MAIRGVSRAQFEEMLPELLTPTTVVRSAETFRGRDKILEVFRRAFVQTRPSGFIYGDRGVGKTPPGANATSQAPVV